MTILSLTNSKGIMKKKTMKVKEKKAPKQKGIDFKKLNPEQRKLVDACIHKFFYAKLPLLSKLSQTKKMSRILKGKTISSLGIEGTLEAVYNQFKEDNLRIIVIDKDNFFVYTINEAEKEMTFLHRVEDGVVVL